VTLFLDDFYYLVRRTPLGDRNHLAAELKAIAITGGAGYAAVRANIFNWVAVMHTQTASTFNAAWEYADLHRVAPLKLDAASSVVLHPFPVSKGRELLAAYLMYQRPKKPPLDTCPFAPEALDSIASISAGGNKGAASLLEPRGLLVNAYEVTSRALQLESVELPIGPAFVAQVLLGAPPTTALTEDEANIPDSERELGGSVVCPCECHADDAPQQFFDVRARIAGATGSVMGYYCASCTLPVRLAADERG
jgi:hypothetical protein